MFKEWEEKAKKRSRQIRDRVAVSSYIMATCTVDSVGCMSSPRRRSAKAEKPVVSGGVSQCILE